MFLAVLLVLGVVPVGQSLPEWTKANIGEEVYAADYPLVAEMEAMAANFEQNLAAAQQIMDRGGFLAPIDIPDPNAIPIYTAEDLYNIRNNLSGSYVLMNDIDLSTFNGGDWVPIGVDSESFSGTFDGQGHIIRNLKIIDSQYQYNGLFGYAETAISAGIDIDTAFAVIKFFDFVVLYDAQKHLANRCLRLFKLHLEFRAFRAVFMPYRYQLFHIVIRAFACGISGIGPPRGMERSNSFLFGGKFGLLGMEARYELLECIKRGYVPVGKRNGVRPHEILKVGRKFLNFFRHPALDERSAGRIVGFLRAAKPRLGKGIDFRDCEGVFVLDVFHSNTPSIIL
jgi:hypothetical protein